jgi:hypothetical protein
VALFLKGRSELRDKRSDDEAELPSLSQSALTWPDLRTLPAPGLSMKRSPIQTLAGYSPNSYRTYLEYLLIGCACRLTDNNYLIRAHARWNHPCLAAEANAPALNPRSRLMFIISHEAEKLACFGGQSIFAKTIVLP